MCYSVAQRLKANPMADYVKQMTPMPFTLTNEDMQVCSDFRQVENGG